MKCKFNRITSLTLAILMVLAIIPATVMAATTAPAPKIVRTGSGLEMVETLEYTFELDPAAVGEWKLYDFTTDSKGYNANTVQNAAIFTEGVYRGQSIFADGKTNIRFTGGTMHYQWTKGYQIWGGDWNVVPAYEIRVIGGKTLMFVEWKSGDYKRQGEVYGSYVLEKVSDIPVPGVTTPEAPAQLPAQKPSKAPVAPTVKTDHIKDTYINSNGFICDIVDYKFELDPAAVGEWKSYDFADSLEKYNPNNMRRVSMMKDAPYLGCSLYADGRMTSHYDDGSDDTDMWSSGYMCWCRKEVAPAYEIKEINGRTFMFVEWKCGDYMREGKIFGYYVLEKVSDTP